MDLAGVAPGIAAGQVILENEKGTAGAGGSPPRGARRCSETRAVDAAAQGTLARVHRARLTSHNSVPYGKQGAN